MECYLGYPSEKIKETIYKRDGWTKIYYVDGHTEWKNVVGELTWSSIGKSGQYEYNYTIQKVEIGNSVTSIGQCAFYGCRYLSSITIPDSVTSIGGDAFNLCTSLISVIIPDLVTSIAKGVFQHCSSLTSITIPNSVTSIENYAFQDCSSLTSITIPKSIVKIGRETFCYCINLKYIQCLALIAPIVVSSTFGLYTLNYTGRNTYSTGTNTLYVPQNATGYDASYWQSVLLNSSKCGFHIEYMS